MTPKIQETDIPKENLGSLEKQRQRLLFVEAGRVLFWSFVLLATFAFQMRQPTFLSPEILEPLYWTLFLVFTINALYVTLFDKFERAWVPTAALFVADAIAITALIWYTGVVQSIFIFLYLVNIIFCGVIFHRKGAMVLALFTSSLFSVLLIFKPEFNGEVMIFSVILNNLGFFTVAMLSGYLSEQLRFMGTELIARRRDLQQLRDLNKLIVDNVTSGLITTDPDGTILVMNRSAESILGFPSIVGQNIFEHLPELKKWTHLAPSNSRVDRFEMSYLNTRDERILLGFSLSPLRSESGVSGFILIFQDLTQIKRLERNMHMTEKMAAVGQLAAGIAHEIRNPLTGISGSLQLLRATTHGEGSEEHRLMTIALKEIDRLNRLITDFLDFVRPAQPVHDSVNLDQLLSEVLDMVMLNSQSKTEAKHVEFKRALNSGRNVLGSRDQLKQVFYNLLINAGHAVEKVEHPEISISTGFESGHVVAKVKDNGAGMSPKTIKRIFEPFYTTKAKGTGLGLATVHKIIENHEAKIFVESEEGRGTEFVVEFTQLDTPQVKKRA
jgi:two-component system sensor histidine kinase PilS (NtrC family)